MTSDRDRVPRVLVMSEHYVSYLCAPDGRATQSFHPTTIASLRINTARDLLLLQFKHHVCDLLLFFDREHDKSGAKNKHSTSRINPPGASLSYFVSLLCNYDVHNDRGRRQRWGLLVFHNAR